MSPFRKVTVMVAEIKVLDCTLRDGGYYNSWDFSPNVVRSYLRAMAGSGVDVVEIGFRFRKGGKFLGPFAFSADSIIDGLDLKGIKSLGIMLNAADWLEISEFDEGHVEHAFRPAAQSRISLVRVAAHIRHVEKCGPLLKSLKRLGYAIGFNIMQSNQCTTEEISRLASVVESYGCVDVLYFADSLGNMSPDNVRDTTDALRQGWSGAIGFHGHDNMGLGVVNALAAIEAGATWVDATVTGMGRGAGNTQIEYLVTELSRSGRPDLNPAPIYDLVERVFGPMQQEYKWGRNIYYYLAGVHQVHPTYVQDMIDDGQFAGNDIVQMIEGLGRSNGASYRASGLAGAIGSRFASSGSWSAAQKFSGKAVALITSAPSAQRHWDACRDFLRATGAACIALNHVPFVDPGDLTAVASCHPAQLMRLLASGANERPLLTPAAAFPDVLSSHLETLDVWDYGLKVDQTCDFKADEHGATSHAPLVAAYAMAAAIAGGASKIYLIGFDGYGGAGPRYVEMQRTFASVKNGYPDVSLISLTPTRYSVAISSVYGLLSA